jgi:hypothetical protein
MMNGKDVEGSGPGAFQYTLPAFALREGLRKAIENAARIVMP